MLVHVPDVMPAILERGFGLAELGLENVGAIGRPLQIDEWALTVPGSPGRRTEIVVAATACRARLLFVFNRTAHVYDLIYAAQGKDYAAEAAVVREQIAQRNTAARSLLDVACGTGGHLRFFAEWYDVMGLDCEPAMLVVARENLPQVPLVEADMRSFDLDRSFDAIVCLFSSVGYLQSATDLDLAAARMCSHLNPGGVLIIDGWVRPDAWSEPGPADALAITRGGISVARVSSTRRAGARTILDLHHLVASSAGVEHIVETHELTLFTEAEYEHALESAGLDFERVDSPMPGRDRYLAVKAAAFVQRGV